MFGTSENSEVTASIHDLHQIAYDLRVPLTHHDHGPPGWYSRSMKRISTRRGMAVWDYKTVLAHELGHAHYGDAATACGHHGKRQERRADLYAAELLIDPRRLHDLALWHRHDLASLAADLEVTPHLLAVYIDRHPLTLKEDTA